MSSSTAPTDAYSNIHASPDSDDNDIPATKVIRTGKLVVRPQDDPKQQNWPRVRGYELLSIIGTGGMGVVFMARHRELQRIVALKTLRGCADQEYHERFRVEAEAVARLQHPNIIQVFEIGSVDAQPGELMPAPFISLEYVEGGSLAARLTAPQSPRFAAQMVEKLARAAHAAHRLGVVHRDLKPANVLLTAEGEPKIADFGLAKHLDGERDAGGRFVTRVGMVVGTPEFMAPEQVAGEAPGQGIDIYALGVILYEMLTGRVPFQGISAEETMQLVRCEEPVPLRKLQPSVPHDLETICLKCLQKEPAHRYESAEALADDLARWSAGLTIRARPVGRAERVIRWARRNPAVALLSLAVVLVTLAGLFGVIWKWREAQTNADNAAATAVTARNHAQAERWARYRANIIAASSALQLHNVGAARRALEDSPPEYCNWEWHHLNTKLDAAEQVLRWEGVLTTRSHITPDGKTLVMYGRDKNVRIWDAAARKELSTYLDEPNLACGFLSTDGKFFIYQTNEHAVVVYDLHNDRNRCTLIGHSQRILAFRFNKDGTRLATTSEDRTFRIWDTQTGQELRVISGENMRRDIVDFSEDGKRMVTVNKDEVTLHVWDTTTGSEIAVCQHDRLVTGGELSPRGDRLVAVDHYPSNVMWLWDLTNKSKPIRMAGHTNQVTEIFFSPDGKRIASCALDTTIRLWQGETGELIGTLDGHRGSVIHAMFSPDSTRLVSGSRDHTVRIWDAVRGKSLAILNGHTDEVFAVAYQPDGKTIVSSARDSTVRFWNAEHCELQQTLRGHTNFVYDVAFHRDGKRVASASWDGTIRLWDTTTARQIGLLAPKQKSIVTGLSFHPHQELLAAVTRDQKVRLWDIAKEEELHAWTLQTDSWRDTRVAFSPQGDLLAAGDSSGVVYLWDVNSRDKVAELRGHRDVIRAVAFSPDGRWLASASDNIEHSICVWDVKTRTLVQVLDRHQFSVNSLAWSADSKLLASGSSDGTARLWNAGTWTEGGVLKHGSNVYGLAFTPDRARLASACADHTIRLWDVVSQQEVAELRGHGEYVHSLAFSPDGTRLVSCSGDFTVRIWDSVRARSMHAGSASGGPRE